MRKIAIVALVALAFGLAAVRAAQPRGVASEGAAAGVSIKDFEFQPRELTVKAGANVTWTNEGGGSHTVTADDGSFESPTPGPGKTFSRKFTKPRPYPHHCALHGGKGGDGGFGTGV